MAGLAQAARQATVADQITLDADPLQLKRQLSPHGKFLGGVWPFGCLGCGARKKCAETPNGTPEDAQLSIAALVNSYRN